MSRLRIVYRSRRRLVTAGCAVALVVGLPTGVALAAPAQQPAGATSTYQEQGVAAALAANPGARRIAVDTVEVRKGIQIRVPVEPNAILGCNNGLLCLNADANYSGFMLPLQACGFSQLAGIGFPGGGTWQDKISSIRNGQTGGVTSRFYDYNGAGQPIETLSLRADNGIPNIGTVNDRIDRIQVC